MKHEAEGMTLDQLAAMPIETLRNWVAELGSQILNIQAQLTERNADQRVAEGLGSPGIVHAHWRKQAKWAMTYKQEAAARVRLALKNANIARDESERSRVRRLAYSLVQELAAIDLSDFPVAEDIARQLRDEFASSRRDV